MTCIRLALLACLALACALPMAANEIETESVDLMRGTIPLTEQNLARHLHDLRAPNVKKSYSISNQLVLGEEAGEVERWTVKDLIFGDGGTLYIGTKDLTLTIDGQLRLSDAGQLAFASFDDARKKASDGTDGGTGSNGAAGSGTGKSGHAGGTGGIGQAGADGLASGDLRLQLRRAPTDPLVVRLVGQDGGDGGNGGKGGNGGNGRNGRTAKSGAFGCERGGGNGGNGGSGGRGGNAGRGGAGGAGGELMVIAPTKLMPRLEEMIRLDRAVAQPGEPGTPGAGGSPGSGGGMGRGSGFCGGGRGGSRGASGAVGAVPDPPSGSSGTEATLTLIDI